MSDPLGACSPTKPSGIPGQISDELIVEPARAQRSPMLVEDEEVHVRWDLTLAGRDVTKLSLEELRVLGDAGIPLKHRHALWPRWFGEPGFGDVEALQDSVSEEAAAQIEADVCRTLPQCLGAAERRTLWRVLRAYAAGNPAVGYCQGMNNIAAVFILLGFDEGTALHGCCSLLHGCCPGYHDRDLGGFRLDVRVLGELVHRVLPAELCCRLDLLDVPLEALVSEHFLTLASRSWPLEATARLWDIVLFEGSPAVFASFLALLQLYLPDVESPALLRKVAYNEEVPEPVEVFRQNVLQGVEENLDHLMCQIWNLIPKVPQALIDQLRTELAGTKR